MKYRTTFVYFFFLTILVTYACSVLKVHLR